jgi:hypothetical protein
MNNAVAYEIPVPTDLDSIVAVNTGIKWIHRIIPGSVRVQDGYITFLCRWHNGQRRFTVSLDVVGGYECDA